MVLSAGYPPAQALAEDERPDLKVELVGLPLTGTQREVQIRVTNVSDWWSDETRLRVTASPPSAGSPLDQSVENLDPDQSVMFRYTLAAACGGDEVKVRAEVTAGKNYAGVPESGDLLKNNTAEGVACAAQAAPKPGAPPGGLFETGPIRGPIEADPMVETDRRSGPIVAESNEAETRRRAVPVAGVVELRPSVVRNTGSMLELCNPWGSGSFLSNTSPWVGWAQWEDLNCAWVFQGIVNFDLTELTRVPNTTIDRAVLTFREQELHWTDENGNRRGVNSCVAILGLTTIEPSSGFGDYPNDAVESKIPYGSREWLVTTYVDLWVRGLKPAYGFVLRGQFEELEATDSTSCVSMISDLKLTVNYTRPASTP